MGTRTLGFLQRGPVVRSLSRALAITLALTVWGPLAPTSVVTQSVPPLNCAVNGFCLDGVAAAAGLMGLPNGTLRVTGYDEWDRLVLGRAAAAWLPLELEARATLARLHGVANDSRLPHFAYDQMRAVMFLRLLTLIRQHAEGTRPLTGPELEALEMLSDLVRERRIVAAQRALHEFDRWASNPCGYVVPDGFGFHPYEPGPRCEAGLPDVSGPPSPPSAKHFSAYGKALSSLEFTSPAAQESWERLALGEVFFVTLASAILATSAAAVIGLFTVAPAALATFVPIAAALQAYGTLAAGVFASGLTAAAATFAAVALPMLVVAATVVFVFGTIRYFEDASVRPDLEDALHTAYGTPDLTALMEEGSWELKEAFIAQTWKEHADPRLNASSDAEREASFNVAPPPAARRPGDPRFRIDGGPLVDSFTFLNEQGDAQQAFVSEGWFVTRTLQGPTWGPWKWRLALNYLTGTLSNFETRTIGIQPDAFVDTGSSPIGRRSSIVMLDPLTRSQTITLEGNRRPQLLPTMSATPTVGAPVVFSGNATDPDGDQIRRVRWFIEGLPPLELFNRLSQAECSLNPPHRIDPVSNLPDVCPWTPLDEVDGAVTFTYTRPGTYTALVMAEDAQGAIHSESFSVIVEDVTPTLELTSPNSVTVPEGQSVTVSGVLDYQAVSNGVWSDLVELAVDWGDGEVTRRAYPCSASRLPVPSDATCAERTTGEFVPIPPWSLTPGPWPFSLSHTFTYAPARQMAGRDIRIYARTTRGASAPAARVAVSVGNVPPVFTPAYTCRVVPINTPIGPIWCIGGDYRDVATGVPLAIRGKIADTPGAAHFIKVDWGDDTSSSYHTGLGEAACGADCPWPNELPLLPAGERFVKLTHTYETPGVYPVVVSLDDGGPTGSSVYTTEARAYGVAAIAGPTRVAGTIPAQYTYSAIVPAHSSPQVTPSCGGGVVGNISADGFTCTFPAVSAETEHLVQVSVVVPGTTIAFSRQLPVTAIPSFELTPMMGPNTPIGGRSATYTYTVFGTPAAPVTFTPSCGHHGTVTAAVDGQSVTCLFTRSGEVRTSAVRVDAIDATGRTAYVLAPITIGVDVLGPSINLPSAIVVDSVSNTGRVVTFEATASDLVSGPAAVSCAPASGALFPIGQSLVTCRAQDWGGNQVHGSFFVTVVDRTPPVLMLPALPAVSATGPDGAAVRFIVSAADAAPASPGVTCLPASGSLFPVGTTTVMCSAVDAAGNAAQGQLTVTVTSAPPGAARDVTASLAFSYGGFTLNRATSRWVQRVTITNAGVQSVEGPISLALTALPTGVTLHQPSGTTAVFYPGSPFRTLAVGNLMPGATVTITLEFNRTGTTGITYAAKVIGGSGTR